MRITEDMNLAKLTEEMGNGQDDMVLPEVLRMRSILCDSEYFERDTEDIAAWKWQNFLDDAVSPMETQ